MQSVDLTGRAAAWLSNNELFVQVELLVYAAVSC
jgi:hypothetical protein